MKLLPFISLMLIAGTAAAAEATNQNVAEKMEADYQQAINLQRNSE